MTILDINAETRTLCDADTTSYPAAVLLRRINNAYEDVISWLINADGTWQFDDQNYTDLPIGTQTLVAAQKTYTFNDKFLQILEVQVKDIDGNWQILRPIDQREYSDLTPLDEDFETDGLPEYYDKISDDTIKLFPGPSATYCTLASGLKIKFKRTASLYTSAEVTTGTKEPGFASPFHYILAYMAAIPYCMNYKKDRVALYKKRVEEMEKGLLEHYSQREKDKRKIITMRQRAFE